MEILFNVLKSLESSGSTSAPVHKSGSSTTGVVSPVYKSVFVMTEPDDDLKCLTCLEVAVDPWQHGKCGRLFCRKCIDKYGGNKPCPNCRMDQPQYFEDNKSKRPVGL